MSTSAKTTKASSAPKTSTSLKVSSTTKAANSTTPYTPVLVTSFPSIPLTATFTPPSDCAGFYTSASINVIDASTTCLPSGFNKDPTAFFSPGIACPSGYYSACHDTTGVQSITTVTCCPFRKSFSLSCADPSSLKDVWSTMFCTWEAPASPGTVISVTLSADGITSTILSAMSAPGGLNAFGVRMVYESTDMSTGPSTATGTNSPGSTSAPPSGSNSGSGLSKGATAAIAVIIPLLAIAALVGGLMWWRRRRSRYNVVESPVSPDHKAPPGTYAYYGDEGPQTPGEVHQGQQLMYGRGWRDLIPQEHQLSELPPDEHPVELPAEIHRE